ncbi:MULTISPECIES: hypothetical protein [Salinibaculum]|uniref:hypothetical protein n=1 Tax=Salinibaculum TaxID=2732368 RepID=UPI0030D62392
MLTRVSKSRLGLLLLFVGALLFTGAGTAAYSVNADINTHQYTITELSEEEATEYHQQFQFKFETLSPTSQRIFEHAVEEGTYTTHQESEQFYYAGDTDSVNIVEYHNRWYLLEATRGGGFMAGAPLYLWVPLTALGGVLFLIGFWLSPYSQRLRRFFFPGTYNR